MERYSQNNEQDFILDFFKDKQTGMFCDVGAFNGVTHSNTRALALLGWRGVLIEPVRSSFLELDRRYDQLTQDKCVTLNVAIGTDPGLKKMWIGVDETGKHPVDAREYSTLLNQERDRWTSCGIGWDDELVLCVPLSFVLSGDCDFLSIDAEGADMDVLYSGDWHRLRPKLVMAEYNGKKDYLNQMTNFLASYKYHLVFDSGQNVAWSYDSYI